MGGPGYARRAEEVEQLQEVWTRHVMSMRTEIYANLMLFCAENPGSGRFDEMMGHARELEGFLDEERVDYFPTDIPMSIIEN